ncbi:diguanylate cyclase [Pseudoclavibacter chungangensis]|uniref:Diguanylate cyclase n=1 Tax=Pseudoclavibacter chungangensis TaxID=587635 RepID=A0A7J5BMP1_9MICO|nr:NAD(P)-binding domain-containing protein [Pseudoclavibacter chungangensis]KAB1652627.1 diguanylate cyclase [Pseudoclavibacter chungangensis]NYJ68371.1 hypothetical protein [Pseudoclavibacter chungangensis]
MTSITIIGTGTMASAIADVASAAGADIQVLGTSEEKARVLAGRVAGTAGTVGDDVTGEIVVLAVPYPALATIADTYGTRLDGRVVVDITNPLDFATFDSLVVAADGSAAAELQVALPGARIVKAFNTNFAGTLSSRELGGDPTTVLAAGDDESARQAVLDLATAAGLAAADAGTLRRARELEALGFLQLTLAASERITWNGGFALRR